jgi:ABC-type antimicrobial peptide transport system permease subunit
MFQQATPLAWIVAKTRGSASAIAAAIREAVRNADSRQAVYSFASMDDLLANSLAPRRFGMRLVVFFAGAALFMAALGLYGVISYSVVQRRREIGVRIALGAGRQGILRLVLASGLRLAATGTVIGIAGSIAGARRIQSQLFQASPFDPLTIGLMTLILLLAATLASYLPALKAMREDPIIALRPE